MINIYIWGTTSRKWCLLRPSSVRKRGWKFDRKPATSQIHLLNLLKHLPHGHGWHLTDVRNFARRQIAHRPIARTDYPRRANPTYCFDYAKSNPHKDKLIFWQLLEMGSFGNNCPKSKMSHVRNVCQFLATSIIDLEIFHRLFWEKICMYICFAFVAHCLQPKTYFVREKHVSSPI